MALVAIITVGALIQYVLLSVRVGQARGKYGVEAPAITGHPMFERRFRVHQNTLEALIVFLPARSGCARICSAQPSPPSSASSSSRRASCTSGATSKTRRSAALERS
jgi:hypothetical protein